MSKIYCCGCARDVNARLTDGREVYPHRPDLSGLPFWKCDDCGNFVGCHHKTRQRTKPLGVIATREIKDARIKIHALIDPIWRSGKMQRSALYGKISAQIGKPYHSGEIRSIEEAREIYRVAKEIAVEVAA